MQIEESKTAVLDITLGEPVALREVEYEQTIAFFCGIGVPKVVYGMPIKAPPVKEAKAGSVARGKVSAAITRRKGPKQRWPIAIE